MASVLLVDDDEMVTLMLSKVLESNGYKVMVRDNGADAIRILKSGAHFDVIVTDLIMSGQDGFDVLQFIRDKNLDTPTLAISSGGETAIVEDLEEAVEGLATAMMSKPVDFTVFLSQVNALAQR